MYLSPEKLKDLLAILSDRFPQLWLLADCYTPLAAKLSACRNPIRTVGHAKVYGIESPDQLAGNGLSFLQEHAITPPHLIQQLPAADQRIFRRLYAGRMSKKLYRLYISSLTLILLVAVLTVPAFAVDDMWTVANNIIVDVYSKIAGISTVLAGLMSAVAVVGAKLSNNQHKVDQAWDWLKRIWIAWAIINGIGAFIAYVAPFFTGLATLTP